MIQSAVRYGIGVLLLIMLFSPVGGQEDAKPKFLKKADRRLFRPELRQPEKPIEFWDALNGQIAIGKYDEAAVYLKGFLASKPSDEELALIAEDEGMSAYLRLLTIPQLRKDAAVLIEQVSAAQKKFLGDPQRIAKYVKNLTASPEERSYAIKELQRSGAAAVPHLIAALIAANPEERITILSALSRLHKSSLPPLYAALDVDDPVIRAGLVNIFRQRVDKDAVPNLWYLAGSPKQPEAVRKNAAETLAFLLETRPEKLLPAKIALTREAERYYQHRVAFPDPKESTIWRWDGKGLVSERLSRSKAEEYYGLRFARQALDLDPTYEPAQVVFLSLALERAYEDVGVDQPLARMPKIRELMATVNADLLTKVLERALTDRRLPVILGTVKALGDLASMHATRGITSGMPALVRALYYADPRVQMAAVDSLLRTPGQPIPPAHGRVIEILRRMLAADAVPKILIAESDKDRAEATAEVVKQAGYDSVIVHNGRDALKRLKEAADIDLILLDYNLPDPQLPYLLAQMRNDADIGLIPIIITVSPGPFSRVVPDVPSRLQRLAESYRLVTVAGMPGVSELKEKLPAQIIAARGKPLSKEERENFAAEAMLWLRRLALGEIAGYDVTPAESAVLKTLRTDDKLAKQALDALGRMPGRVPQREIAALVLDDKRPPDLRIAAAEELVRNIQKIGLVLTRDQIKRLQDLFRTGDDPKLKAQVALVIGAMGVSPKRTGEVLQRYTPAAAPAAEGVPAPKEKEVEKEKAKEPDKEKEKEQEKEKEKEKEKD